MCARRAAGYGIFALLDMHQDTFSAKYCGEGVPDWAVYAGSEWLTHIYVLSIFELAKASSTHVVEKCAIVYYLCSCSGIPIPTSRGPIPN